jgi:hypothetical protein
LSMSGSSRVPVFLMPSFLRPPRLPRCEIASPALGATGMHSQGAFVDCAHFVFGGARCFEVPHFKIPWPVTVQLMSARVLSDVARGRQRSRQRPRLGPKPYTACKPRAKRAFCIPNPPLRSLGFFKIYSPAANNVMQNHSLLAVRSLLTPDTELVSTQKHVC